jgi:copper chaperone CopZ
MSTVSTIKVAGMTCAHCAGAVTAELSALPGVSAVDIGPLAEVTAVTVTSADHLDSTAVSAAIEEAGYQLADS